MRSMALATLNAVLTELKTKLETDLVIFETEIIDYLKYDTGDAFMLEDNRQNIIKLRAVPDDEGKSIILSKLENSWDHYRYTADCQLLCQYVNVETDNLVDSILSVLRQKHEVLAISWDPQAILERLTGERSTKDEGLVLVDFRIAGITNLQECETLCIK